MVNFYCFLLRMIVKEVAIFSILNKLFNVKTLGRTNMILVKSRILEAPLNTF